MIFTSTMSPKYKGLLAAASLLTLMLTLLPAPTAQAVDAGKRTFKVTAYYSPLPNQSFYLQGNYDAEIRMNGNGTHGASGREVFPGMIAAPKTYAFGTKIKLEGLGIGTVTDRGGAIVKAGEGGQEFDRIDVWMGYGEPALRRALKWGVRVVSGEVLTDSNTPDSIYFDSMSPDIASMSPQQRIQETITKDGTKQMIAEVEAISEQDELSNSFPGIMGRGAEGIPVKILQSALKQLGYYKLSLSGVYDGDTMDALLRFQIDKKLISGLDDTAAGYFGAKTRIALVEQLQAVKITMDVLENEALLEDMRDGEIRDEDKLKQDLVFRTIPHSQMDMLVANTTPTISAKPTSSATLASASSDTLTAPTVIAATNPALADADVILLKRELHSLGFYDGDMKSTWNAALTTALKALQKQGATATQDGTYTQETRIYLSALWTQHVTTWGFFSTLDVGANGEQVTKLQSLLTRQGMFTGAIDGVYRDSTKAAVLAFQLHYGVVSDPTIYGAGLVGPRTVQMLNNVLFQLQ